MALPTILSPMKASMSPLGAKVNALAASPASSAKRSLAALQGFVSSCHQPAAATRRSSSSNSSSSIPAPQRVEQGVAGLFAPPVTLLVAEPVPGLLQASLAPAAGSEQQHQPQRRQQQQQQLRQLARQVPPHLAPAHHPHHNHSHPHPQQQQQQRALSSSSPAADTAAAADQLPPPFAVLEAPPGLEEAPGPGPASPAPGPAPAMSGRRVSARYDVPLGFDWAHGAPDHAPALGEGRLEVIAGPMFAGKTTALIARVGEVTAGSGQLAVVVKSSADVRYGAHWVVSHDGRCMRCYTAATLSEFRSLLGAAYAKAAVIAIDEAQFFPDLLQFCSEAVDGDGKHVIVAGLSGDFRRRRFGQVMDLLPLADSITQLSSTCSFCGGRALFSLRLVDGGPLALVGGEDKYRATCRRCYLTHSRQLQ